MSKRERLERMLESEPDDVFLNYALAQVLAAEGRTAAALERFDRVTQLDGDYVPAHFQRGQVLARSGNVEDARRALEAGIAAARRVGDTHALGEMTEYLAGLR